MSSVKRAALFVDFDNIYLGLRQVDPAAAEEFATNPGRWLAWLEQHSSELSEASEHGPKRRILFRNCYLNPRSFSRYRSDFSRAAFRVIDCPPITGKGKTSTDIHMVMDILDTLDHSTHFDEFIVLSADADFTPVLFRLRERDRRTLVVSVGPASAAYRNSTDLLVSEDEFISMALGGYSNVPRTAPDADRDALFDGMVAALAETAAEDGRLEPGAIPRVYVRFPEFRESTDWLGHWSLRGLTEALIARRPEGLELVDDNGQWFVEPQLQASQPGNALHDEVLEGQILDAIQDCVAASPVPVALAAVAQHVLSEFPEVTEAEWAGYGSLKALLGQSKAATPQLVQLAPTRWVIVDAERHEVPENADTVTGDTDAARLARRISRTTGVPALTSEQYTELFSALQDALRGGEYDLTETSKAVRDRLLEHGTPISRTSVSFILRGLAFIGCDLSEPSAQQSADDLARAFRRQIHSLCEEADLALTSDEERLVDEWILGMFSKAS